MPTETLIFLGFLLVLAAACGWWLARLTATGKSGRVGRLFNTEYFRGLNFLLNEQPDKAIEVFVRMVEVDSDTVETHFALGSLFRRRGEVDRAIRIHQNLIARPNLSRMHRSHALYELGEDYMKAGLFDRAENLFLELSNDRLHMEHALRHLVTIYEQQKDWEQAIATARQLESASGISRHQQIAQYYCELAASALETGDRRQAVRMLKRGQGFDRRSVRVALMQAGMAQEEGDIRQAVRGYRRALELDIEFAVEILPPLNRLHVQAGTGADFSAYLNELRYRSPAAITQIALTVIVDSSLHGSVAEECVEEFIRISDGLHGLHELIELISGESRIQHANARERVQAVLRRLLTTGARYKCHECGFTGKTLYWQCPSCKTWNSTRPHFDFSLSSVLPVPEKPLAV